MTISVREIHDELLQEPEFAFAYLNIALEGDEADIAVALRRIAEARRIVDTPLFGAYDVSG